MNERRHNVKTVTIPAPKKCNFCFKRSWIKAKQCVTCKKIFHADCMSLANKYEECEFSSVELHSESNHRTKIMKIKNNELVDKKWLKASPSFVNTKNENRASLRPRIELKEKEEEEDEKVGSKLRKSTLINSIEIEIINDYQSTPRVEIEEEKEEEETNYLRVPTLEKNISSLETCFPKIRNEENKRCSNNLSSNFQKLCNMDEKNSNSDILKNMFIQIQLNQQYNPLPYINVPQQQQQQLGAQNNPNNGFIFNKNMYQIRSSG